jgi:hypothetical protein
MLWGDAFLSLGDKHEAGLGWLDSMPGVVSIDRRGAKNACLHHPRLMKRVTQAKTESFIKKDVLTLPT